MALECQRWDYQHMAEEKQRAELIELDDKEEQLEVPFA